MAECERMKWPAELALTRWHWAHLTGHIGDDLEAALAEYAKCETDANKFEDEILAARAFNGSAAINFTRDGGASISVFDLESRIEAISDLPGNGPTLSALYRNLSRLHRLNGDSRAASVAIEQSAKVARLTGLRTLINCDYGRAGKCTV